MPGTTSDESLSPAGGPHRGLAGDDPRERFCCHLFDRLWARYRQRVVYAATYEEVVASAGATFENDHIAFRTFASQQPTTGIVTLSRIFEALGYQPAATYQFPNKNLGAIHFRHPNPRLPKLFISELRLWELPPAARRCVAAALASHRRPIDDQTLASLATLPGRETDGWSELLDVVVDFLERLPWDTPSLDDLNTLNQHSQYAAWVLVHGYNVNHFTSLINSHQVDSLGDIERTVAALSDAGVPMKSQIEGAAGSRLRQTATEAVVIDVAVREQGEVRSVPWTYAYFELAQRGEVKNPETGRGERFEGFLGSQASQLFEMTRRS